MQLIQLKLDDMRGKIPRFEPSNGVWVCGGAVRRWFAGGEDLSDIDVFAPSQTVLDSAVKPEFKKIDDHKNATTYEWNGLKVQFVKVFHQTLLELLASFDYNVCQFAWTEDGIFATPEAIIGVLRGHLSVATIRKDFAVDSLRRAFKYQRKGFQPCAGTIRDIALALRDLSEEEIKAQVELSPKGGKRIVHFD